MGPVSPGGFALSTCTSWAQRAIAASRFRCTSASNALRAARGSISCLRAGCRLLIAVLGVGAADKGLDRRVVIALRFRVWIPMVVAVVTAYEERAAPPQGRAHIGRYVEGGIADTAPVGTVRQ